MSDRPNNSPFAGPGVMLLGAAIFGYFGFTTSWNYYSAATGQLLLFVALLDWTMKGTAIGLGVSAVLTFLNSFLGNLSYCIISLLSAVSFVIVGVLDILDDKHMAMSPVLLFIFAAWNGFGSWNGLKELLAYRAALPHDSTFAPPSP